MAIAVGQHATAHATSTATTAGVTTASSGSSFLIFIAYDSSSANLSSVGDNKSNTYSNVQAKFNGATFNSETVAVAAYLCTNGTGGSGHTFTATSSNSFLAICAVEITGGATSGLIDGSIVIAADGTSPYTSGNKTVTNANELLLSFMGCTLNGTRTFVAGNSFTLLDSNGNSTWWGAALGWKAGPAAGGSDGGSWTFSGAQTEGSAVLTMALNPPSSAVQVNLTGQSSTGSAGTLAPSARPTLAGSSASGSAGSFGKRIAPALAGLASSGGAGTFSPRLAAALSGIVSTASAGSFIASHNVFADMVGIESQGSAGTLSPRLNAPLVGIVVTGSAGQWSLGRSARLTGAFSAGGAGSLHPALRAPLSGAQSASAAGAWTVAVRAYLTGSSSAGQTGALSPPGTVTATLVGQSATGSAGNFHATRSATLTGQGATSAAGSFRAQHAAHLSGLQAMASAGSFRVAVLGYLSGAQSAGHTGSFVFTPPSPKLVSITFENVGSACSLSIVNIGSKATTTITDLD